MAGIQAIPTPPVPPFPSEVFFPGGPVESIIMAVIALAALVVGGIVLLPIMRAFARRIEGRAGDPGLQVEVEQLRTRVEELENVQHRLAELEERVDFGERLLADSRAGRRELPQ